MHDMTLHSYRHVISFSAYKSPVKRLVSILIRPNKNNKCVSGNWSENLKYEHI